MKKYIVFTVVSGYSYYICFTEEKQFFVSSDAPDHEVVKWDHYKDANDVATDNSKNGIEYKVKEVTL